MNKPLILVVEDDAPIRNLITTTLKTQDYKYIAAATASEALQQATIHAPDVMLLDLGLPDLDGIEVIRRIRSWSAMPIIVISARSEDSDKIEALYSGADDYLGKPFSLKEVQARLNALIRRSSGRPSPLLTYGNVAFDPETRKVTSAGREVVLSPKETALLELLLLNKNKVLSKEAIESKIYSWDDEVSSNAVEVHIHHLRKKLGKDIVRTVNKIGYILEET